jgi:hypothetical protein
MMNKISLTVHKAASFLIDHAAVNNFIILIKLRRGPIYQTHDIQAQN